MLTSWKWESAVTIAKRGAISAHCLRSGVLPTGGGMFGGLFGGGAPAPKAAAPPAAPPKAAAPPPPAAKAPPPAPAKVLYFVGTTCVCVRFCVRVL